jgi:hypothetical protein
VLPKHRNTTRMDFKLSVEEDSQWKMFVNLEDYKNRMVSWKVEEQNGIIRKYHKIKTL